MDTPQNMDRKELPGEANQDWRKVKYLLTGLTLCAVALRVWQINFGLPDIYHPDEAPAVIIAQNIFKTGDLNPHFFHWPSLVLYLNALVYIPYYLIGKLLGDFHTVADIPGPTMLAVGVGQTSLPATWLLGRGLTVVFGSANIILIFLIGQRLTHKPAVGLLAALMMVVSPINVAHSRFITPDTFTVFFTLLSFYGSVQVFQEGRWRDYLLAGVGVGLTMSAKYNGALIALPLILAHFLRHGLKGLKDYRLYLALFGSIIVFLATTPFALLDYPKFLADLQFDAQHYATGHAGMEGNALSWYLVYLWSVEGPVTFLAVLELVRGLYTRSKPVFLLAAFPGVYFIFISNFVVRNERTLLPLTPFLFLLTASLLVNWLDLAHQWQPERKFLANFSIGLITFSLLIWPFVQTIKNSLPLTMVDSRETAKIWLEHHLPGRARIALEAYAPYVDSQHFLVQGLDQLIYHPPDWYIANGFDYLIFSQGAYGRYYQEPDRYAAQIAQYETLFHAFDLVKRFNDGDYEIRVYQVPKEAQVLEAAKYLRTQLSQAQMIMVICNQTPLLLQANLPLYLQDQQQRIIYQVLDFTQADPTYLAEQLLKAPPIPIFIVLQYPFPEGSKIDFSTSPYIQRVAHFVKPGGYGRIDIYLASYKFADKR